MISRLMMPRVLTGPRQRIYTIRVIKQQTRRITHLSDYGGRGKMGHADPLSGWASPPTVMDSELPIIEDASDDLIDSNGTNKFIQEQTIRVSTSPLPLPTELLEELYGKQECAAILKRAERLDKNLTSLQMSKERSAKFLDAVRMLQLKLTSILSKRYPGTRIDVCGSCLSELFTEDSDVDLSIHIPQLQKSSPKTVVQAVYMTLRQEIPRQALPNLESIRRPSIPVVKGRYIGSHRTLSFDICVANDMSVANSKLLREYTRVDAKAKALLSAVHIWAKQNKITSAAHGYLSSYAWTNLAIFYLQHVGLLPNLQCPDLMRKTGLDPNSLDPSHMVDGLRTCFAPWDRIESCGAWSKNKEWTATPLSLLLHGFFHFYAYDFPRDDYVVSIRVGNVSQSKAAYPKAKHGFFCIEDPFRIFCSPEAHDLSRPVLSKNRQARILRALMDGEGWLRRRLLRSKT